MTRLRWASGAWQVECLGCGELNEMVATAAKARSVALRHVRDAGCDPDDIAGTKCGGLDVSA